MKPVDQMSFSEVVAELKRYQPAVAAQVITTAEHLARRKALWLRLDALYRAPRSGIFRIQRQPAASWHGDRTAAQRLPSEDEMNDEIPW